MMHPFYDIQNSPEHTAPGLHLVRVKGLEPLAYWFVASHSIQLSYTRKLVGEATAEPEGVSLTI